MIEAIKNFMCENPINAAVFLIMLWPLTRYALFPILRFLFREAVDWMAITLIVNADVAFTRKIKSVMEKEYFSGHKSGGYHNMDTLPGVIEQQTKDHSDIISLKASVEHLEKFLVIK